MTNDTIQLKKKIVDPTPNRLFITWMEEIKRVAKRNQDKSYFTYKKALQSLKKYPLPVTCGKDCIILEGFGEKTCALLDKKLAELAKNQGVSVKKALKNGNRDFKRVSSKGIAASKSSLDFGKGSECFALIFALNELEAGSTDESIGHVKKEILLSAQKFYRNSKNPNCSEALWRSMPKLIKSDLVKLDGLRYHLCQSGKELQSKLLASKEDVEVSETVPDKANQNSPIHSENLDQFRPNFNNEEVFKETQIDGLQFSYCKHLAPNNNEFVNTKSEAAVKIIDEKKYVRVKIKYEELMNCSFEYLFDMDALDSGDDFVIVFFLEADAPYQGCYVEKNHENISSLSSQPIINTNNLSQKSKPNNKRISDNYCESHGSPSKMKRFDCPDERVLRNTLKLGLVNSKKTAEETVDLSKIEYKMLPQSFEIILIVDNRESFGIGKLKERLCPELTKKGIKLETRVLPVGDFAWIARDRNGREAVLDIIVERKTYDDLAKSIMDNRFKDQKLRIKRSGISKVIYLLEKCKGMKNLSISVDTLHQSLINSERFDNCDIQITENGADTISYLNVLTKKLCEFYANKSLNVYRDCIPKECKSFNPFNSNAQHFSGIDYASFNDSAQKTKPLRISEMFAKHICCISGMSIEKTKAVVDKYPTPRLLIEAYENLPTDKERQLMLSGLKLISNKNLGPNCSKIVYASYSRK